ncbi:MAG: transposase [Planctomycetes bacterium]|nr:transposase [Planctomycetota bacterium]
MSRRAYSEINLHITWHVKDDEPILRDAIEDHLHRHFRERVDAEPGVFWRGSGGTGDHVHVVVSISPEVPISEWVGRLKGESSHYINHVIVNRKLLHWQGGYGVVSFGTKDLPWVLGYVCDQRRLHAERRTHERLERTEPVQDDKPAEAGS